MRTFLSAAWQRLAPTLFRLRHYWWALVALLAALGLGLIYATLDWRDEAGAPASPELQGLRNKVAQAEEDALRVKVTATVRAEDQKRELAEVVRIEDGAERRKRLAAMLERL